MHDYINKKIENLLRKFNLNNEYEIRKTNENYNFLYVTKEYKKIIFNINYEKLNNDLIDVFLLHEIFHILQYEQNFPMLVLSKETKKYDIVQKIITDLYNTKMMIENNCFQEAFMLHNYRLNNAKININSLKETDDIYRVSYIIAEHEIFFENKENNSKLKNRFINEKTKEIYECIIDKYTKEDIYGMYLILLKCMDKNIKVSCFDQNIIIL